MHKKIFASIVGVVGYLLSPLSWWNDAFVNIPLAYGFGALFALISRSFFLPMMVLGYWATNVLGLMLMHYGISTVSGKGGGRTVNMKQQMLVALAYSVLIVVLIRLNIVRLPAEYFK